MTATSATDAWAVGLSGNANASSALTEYWNGTKWTRVPSPNPVGSGELLAVAATSPGNAWAVSGAAQQGIGVNKSVIDHWDGAKWMRAPSANPVPGGAILLGVAATSASDAWAVGIDTDFVTSFENVIEHWNGSTWTLSRSPVQDGDLNAVAATSPSNAWAVGSTTGSLALVEHWNGSTWAATTFH